ncbi:MAG: hypothetical protein ACOZNI_35765 [Myxococcota bacterium]
MTLLIALLAGCPPTGEWPDSGKDDTGTCNTDNEDCAPSVCGGEGATMLPGADCLACHTAGNLVDDKGVAKGSDDGDKLWSAGGTVFADLEGTEGVAGAIVRITDADGQIVTLTSNRVGNFYTALPLTFPIAAEVERDGEIYAMQTPQDSGACNSCHRCDGAAGGKLFAP